MWSLVYAFIAYGQLEQYSYDYSFDTLEECEYYAQNVLADELVTDDGTFRWTCV